MSQNKSSKLRKAGEPVCRKTRSALKLIKSDVKPSLGDIEFPDEVKDMLSEMKRKRIYEVNKVTLTLKKIRC